MVLPLKHKITIFQYIKVTWMSTHTHKKNCLKIFSLIKLIINFCLEVQYIKFNILPNTSSFLKKKKE